MKISCCNLKKITLIFFSAVFFLSFFALLTTVVSDWKEERAFKILAQSVNDYDTEQATNNDKILPQYQELYKQNTDLAGWIKIENTNINYPVMFTPDDIEYYLRRSFDGSSSNLGVPFIGYNCSLEPRSTNILIYGHNMNNGAMFHDLLKYQNKDFYLEHSLVNFDTLKETAQYEIIAAFYTRIYPENYEDVFRYYEYTNLTDPLLFAEFINNVTQESLYDTGITAEYGDLLLTLSTCSYHADNGRFVVIARKQTSVD